MPLASWETPTWEPYRVAVSAFYALCVQRSTESLLEFFRADPLLLEPDNILPVVSENQLVCILQFIAFIIWVSLYFVYNTSLHFSRRPSRRFRTIATHGLLTVSLIAFYLFGATIGHPGRTQLGYIILILALDACLPLLMGGVLQPKQRQWWAFRGVGQTIAIIAVYVLVPHEILKGLSFALVFLGLMVFQLIVLAPIEVRSHSGRGGGI